MSRRKRIHGRRRKRSPLQMASAATSMFSKYINGAIGAFDKQKAAEDRASEPDSTKEGDYVTKTEVRDLVNRSIKGQTPAQPKQNKASETEASAKETIKTAQRGLDKRFGSSSIKGVRR